MSIKEKTVPSDCAQSGMGVALGEDGTVYAATQKTGSVAAHVTAISAQGVKRWEHAADGDINGDCSSMSQTKWMKKRGSPGIGRAAGGGG